MIDFLRCRRIFHLHFTVDRHNKIGTSHTMSRKVLIENAARRVASLIFQRKEARTMGKKILQASGELPPLSRSLFLKFLLREVRRRMAFFQTKVETPDDILPSQCKELSEKFSAMLGRDIALENEKNPALIAGVRVTIGDQRWERSIRRQLDSFSKK